MNHLESVSADTRIRILDEAERLFRVYGYSKTTVADIADAADMSPSNVYRFFSSKSAINEAICERLTMAQEVKLRALASLPLSASERLRRLASEIYRHTVETYLDEKKVHEMVVVALEEQWGTVQAHLIRVTQIIEDIIRDGIGTGEFRVEDPNLAARCVHAAFAPLSHPTMVAQCINFENKPRPEELAEFVVRALRA